MPPLKYCKRNQQWKSNILILWIYLWKVIWGIRVDRINFWCSFETENVSWQTEIPFPNQFKMDLEGAYCLGFPCAAQRQCVASGLNAPSVFSGGHISHWKADYDVATFAYLKCKVWWVAVHIATYEVRGGIWVCYTQLAWQLKSTGKAGS